jgi:signal transduction histidine kinase
MVRRLRQRREPGDDPQKAAFADSKKSPSLARLVTQFAVSGLVALLVVAVTAVVVLRRTAVQESIRDARRVTQVLGVAVIEPILADGVVRGDPAALAALDRVVRERVVQGPVVRVKLWTPGGRIVYSDEPRLIGSHYPVGEEEQGVLATGRVAAELSDLARPENRYERREHELLEVYMPVHTQSGKLLLFESYMRFSSVTASGRKVWLAFLPALLAALVLLWLFQLPLAASLARRLRQGQRQRETLLLRALDASEGERRRIAADLHDGVVQDLAGTSMTLAVAARQAPTMPRQELATALRAGADSARQSMRQLRSLLVEIYPPNLRTAGLPAALPDLLAGLTARGIKTELRIDDAVDLSAEAERLVFRTAQEAVRNVADHARAQAVEVSLTTTADGVTELVVSDDGRGFSAGEIAQRRAAGHLGLTLIEDRARSVGGELTVDSRPGQGTRITLRIPT